MNRPGEAGVALLALMCGAIGFALSYVDGMAPRPPRAREALVESPVRTPKAVSQPADHEPVDEPDPFPSWTLTRKWKRILLVPMVGELPPSTLEEGPPWHAVLRRDGTWGLTKRWKDQRPGVPEGWPIEPTRECLLVAIPHARSLNGARKNKLHKGIGWLVDRMESHPRVLLPSDLPGIPWTLPRDLSRADILE